MHLTLRQLRLMVALEDAGSVTGAARALHVTQPTVSAQLREITHAVGLPVYEVVGRRLRLTDVGRSLVRTARSMLVQWQQFEQGIDALRGLQRGHLRVAVVSTAKYFMPRLLGQFCQRHPGVDLALEILNRDGVVARLRDDLDDLYVMSQPPHDLPLHDEVFLDNPLVLIAPARHRWLRHDEIALADLRDQPFILREPASGTRMATQQHFRKVRFRPHVRLELGSNEAIKEAVAGGLGLGVISRHALHGRRAEHGVVELPVLGFPIASQWHIVRPRGRLLSPVAEAFEQALRQAGRSGQRQRQPGEQADQDQYRKHRTDEG